MTGAGIQHTVIIKLVFCPLDNLPSGHLISVFVKEIGCTINGLPAGISVLPCCFAVLSVKFLNIIIIIIYFSQNIKKLGAYFDNFRR